MAFAEDQKAVFTTTASFQPDMELAVADSKADPLIASRLEVRSEGDWYKARVVDARNGSYRVHYFGYEDADDEWVSRRQFRAASAADIARDTRGAVNGRRESTEYRSGTNVEVNWHGKWYAAKILEAKDGRHLVHYAGYDESWDEWVSNNRIRRPSWNN